METDDKPGHRIVTGISLLLGLLLFALQYAGLLGETARRFSLLYLVFVLLILGLRAMLTELGIRRKRLR